MKTVVYWSPFLTHVATISSVIESAKSLKKYSKKYDPVIIDACGEFESYSKTLVENKIDKTFSYCCLLKTWKQVNSIGRRKRWEKRI